MNKYIIDTDENKAFLKQLREELFAFGKNFPSESGASYYLGDDGSPWKDRPRETWITCRMAHVYSMGAMLGVKGCDILADKALEGLLGELFDKQYGGWYAGIRADGSVLPDKQCYAHAFVILAATSALLAERPRAKELLALSRKIYDERFWDEEKGLAKDTWDTEFKVPDAYRGLNANMHSVEAFLAMADATGEEMYRIRAGRIIDHVICYAKENDWRIPEHYTEDWKADLDCNKKQPDDPFKPYGATPGHGIEWARLITQWAMSSYAEDENKAASYILAAKNLYGRAVTDAWSADGAPGFVYTTDWDGQPVVRDRMHWTLAEAINTSAVLYRVTGEETYANDYAVFLQYLEEKVLDKVHGSWFHQLDQTNKPIDTVWPGKPDIYHALQATLIPYQRVDTSIAAAIKKGNRIADLKE